MTRKLILGFDIGTSSVRAGLYDQKGKMVADSLVKNERQLTATDEGGSEIDADVAFKQIVAAIDDVLDRTADIDEIEYVASCSFWHSLVGVDAKGKPTTKVLGWADTRSRKYSGVLRKRLNESETHDRTGARFHSSFWPAKLLWLKNENKGVFVETEKWLSFSDYVSMRIHKSLRLEKHQPAIRSSKREWQFAGVPKTGVSMASATGIFDIRECVWDRELLDVLGLHEFNFPSIVESDQYLQLNRTYAKRWPQLKESSWFPTIGDGAANNIGAGCVKRSKAALMIGTSGALRVAFRGEPPTSIPHGLWCYRIDRERIIIGGALSDGGGLYRWLKDTLHVTDDDDQIEAEIERRGPDAHGLTFMPFVAGERSTGYNEDAAGLLAELRSSTDPIDIIHAALEAVAFRFAEIAGQLNDVCKVREIIASGGALRASPVWTQIIADVLGRNMTLPGTREASMRGAVLLGLETIGKIESIEDIPTPTGKHFSADKSRRSVYAAARRRHQEAYKLLIDRENPE